MGAGRARAVARKVSAVFALGVLVAGVRYGQPFAAVFGLLLLVQNLTARS